MNRLVDNRSPWATRVAPSEVCNMVVRDLNNPFNRYSLLLSQPRDLIDWLRKESFLADNVQCERCNDQCSLRVRERVIDGFVWRCKNRHEISIRRHSFFARSHLRLQDIMNFVITYAEGQSLWKCSRAAGIGYGSTAVNWGSFCRDLFMEYYVRKIKDVKFNREVEMGESLFGRRTKYHRGDPRGLKVWIFGITERQTNRLKLFPVDNRDQITLMQIIKDNVEPTSTVITNG